MLSTRLIDYPPVKRASYRTSRLITQVAKEVAKQFSRQNDLTWWLETVDIAMADEDLTTILKAILENALAFSQPGSSVALSASLRGEEYVISVRCSCHLPAQTATNTFTQAHPESHEQQLMMRALRLMKLARGHLSIQYDPNEETIISVALPHPATPVAPARPALPLVPANLQSTNRYTRAYSTW